MALTALTGPWPIFYTTLGLLEWVINMSQGRYLYMWWHKHRISAYTDIHTLSGIRTHDPSIRVSEDSSYLRWRGCCDRWDVTISYPSFLTVCVTCNMWTIWHYFMLLGSNPCEKRLRCDDHRCIPIDWCCDTIHDSNCTARVLPPCCLQLSKCESSKERPIYFTLVFFISV
jgi:hypothetical protein